MADEIKLNPGDKIQLMFPHPVKVDPLMWFEAEENPPSERFPAMPLTLEQSFYEFLNGPRQYHRDLTKFIERYRQITAAEREVPFRIVPGEPRIVGRLLLPLRHAKASFVVGNLLGTIALCGMVAEMAAILTLELSAWDPALKDAAAIVTAEAKKRKPEFADLGQATRVRLLKDHGLIDDRQFNWFGNVRGARRLQLHFLDQKPPTEAQTLSIYSAARGVFATTIGNDYRSGESLGLKPSLTAMLSDGFEPETLEIRARSASDPGAAVDSEA
jgi:hypothetical protein